MTALKFEVGLRVRKRGHGNKGTVKAYPGKDSLGVHSCDRVTIHWDGSMLNVNEHVETVKRLKPKPKAESKAPREFWLNQNGSWYTYKRVSENEIHVTELRPGEAVVSREELAKAWKEHVSPLTMSNCTDGYTFDSLCKALNLSPEGKV